MFTISLLAQKGGTGKTTLARCLAVAYEREGKSTAIVDLDPQASAALWFERREAEHPEVLSRAVALLDKVLDVAKDTVEIVIIDTPPKSSDIALAAAKRSDLVIIPCRPQIDDIETLAATQLILHSFDVPTFVFLNAVPPYAARVKEATEAIENHPEAPFAVCPFTFGHRAAFGDSSVLGLTPQEYEPKGKAAKEVDAMRKWVSKIASSMRGGARNGKKAKSYGKTKAKK